MGGPELDQPKGLSPDNPLNLDFNPSEPIQLSEKESDERTNEIENVFGKIADFHQRGEDLKDLETARVASIIKIDKKLDPMKAEMEKLLEKQKSTSGKEKEEVKKTMTALEEKMTPLVTARREITDRYTKIIDGTLFPKLVKTVRDGGSGNDILAGKMKKNVNVYENLGEVNNALQWSAPPVGLGLTKDNLMDNQSKLAKKAQEFWSASPSQWAAFKKKIDSIDTAFTDAKTGVEAAKKTIS
ncbi:hypothetical protein KJ657_02835 [Patescibacteria group bacterium]|nr:hypothetical protein [Patescibacteria group bacterium]MBU1016000.1 hypothetical protein [Patescibacteria group bacterium]MBU1684791.1 hypothetical protein [Patescibacteria group bacterium]MBU1938761.1 hypothetical protein [Patescibacteria group bacterium]